MKQRIKNNIEKNCYSLKSQKIDELWAWLAKKRRFKSLKLEIKRREFLCGTVVRTQHFHCSGPGLAPGQGTKIPQSSWQAPKNKIRQEGITIELSEIKRIIREYYEKSYASKLNNLDKMEKFLENLNFESKFKKKQKI